MPNQFSCLAAAWDLVPSPHLGPAIAPLDHCWAFFIWLKLKTPPNQTNISSFYNNIAHPIEKVHNSNESTKW